MGLRIRGHHDQKLGQGSIGGPKLGPVEDVGRAVLGLLRGGGHARRVGAHSQFGEREGGYLALGAAGEVLLLLLGRSEELDRLRHPDRLMGREQGPDVAAIGSEQLHYPVVFDVGETQAPVFLRDLHSEGPERAQPVEDPLRVLAGAIDLRRIDFVLEEGLEALVEVPELRPLVPAQGIGMNEIQPEVAEEQFLDEAWMFPLRFAGGLRDVARLELADVLAGVLRLQFGFGHGSLASFRFGRPINEFRIIKFIPYSAWSRGGEGGQAARTLRSLDFMDDSNDGRGTATALRRSAVRNSLRARAGIFATIESRLRPRLWIIPARAR